MADVEIVIEKQRGDVDQRSEVDNIREMTSFPSTPMSECDSIREVHESIREVHDSIREVDVRGLP